MILSAKRVLANHLSMADIVDIMRKCISQSGASTLKLFVVIACKHTSFIVLYRLKRDCDGDSTKAATTSYVGVKSLMRRRTSFILYCVLSSMTTEIDYTGNKPLCASTRALHFGNDGKEC